MTFARRTPRGARAIALVLTAVGIAAGASSKAPIVIGATADRTGFVAPSAGLAQSRVFDVWAKWINDKGGIAGHPVVLLNKDAASDPATGARVLGELLSDPKVIAVVHGGNDTGAAAIVANATAPVIGGTNDESLGPNANVFPASTTVDGAGAAVGNAGVLSSAGHPSGGVLYSVEMGAEGAVALIRAGAEKAGGMVAFTAGLTRNDHDYGAQCLTAKAKNVGWMTVIDLPATIVAVAEACAKAGFRPVWINGYFDPAWLAIPALDRTRLIMPDTLFSGSSPAAETFRQAVAKYDPDLLKAPTFNQYSLMAWTALQLVAKAIEEAHPTGAEVTRDDVYRGLYSLKEETLGGLAPPLTYVRGKPTSVSCYFTAEIRSGKLVTTSTKPVC